MVTLCNRADHYIFALLFLSIYLSSSSFFPRLISAAAGWMSTILDTWCGPSANLECRYERCCTRLAANAGPKKVAKNSPSGHHRTILSGFIFATKSEKIVKQQCLPHVSSQYGELQPTSGLDLLASLMLPANFDRFRVLAALLHGTLVVSVSQTLRR